jgi:hypothetical protein
MTTVASETFDRIKLLVQSGSVRISEHGYDELAADNIFARDVVEGVQEGKVVEDYPSFPKGPSVLVLQQDRNGGPIHAVWGIPKGHHEPAVLITAYRPDPTRWENDLIRRRK